MNVVHFDQACQESGYTGGKLPLPPQHLGGPDITQKYKEN